MRYATILLLLLGLPGTVSCRTTPPPRDELVVNGEVMDLDTMEQRLDAGTLIERGDPLIVRYPRFYTRAEVRRLITLVRDAVMLAGGIDGQASIQPHDGEP